jgi:purine-binding chemotaxis protein CheW
MSTAPRQYVTFSLMGEEYGVEISYVREIIELEPLTRIPGMPPVVRGVINLRGSVVAIVDLPLKFGLPETEVGPGTYVIVFDLVWSGESVRLGLMTRDLGQVLDVAERDVKPVPDFGTRMRADYLLGIARVDPRFVLLLNVDRLLSPAELLEINSAQREATDDVPPAAGHEDTQAEGT